MDLAFGVFIFIASIAIIIISLFFYKANKRKAQDRELLHTVTESWRGTSSERSLVLLLLKAGIPAQTIFHDLYLNKLYGGFSQIDLVVATSAGVLVFEVKDYSGWIFGKGYQKQCDNAE